MRRKQRRIDNLLVSIGESSILMYFFSAEHFHPCQRAASEQPVEISSREYFFWPIGLALTCAKFSSRVAMKRWKNITALFCACYSFVFCWIIQRVLLWCDRKKHCVFAVSGCERKSHKFFITSLEGFQLENQYKSTALKQYWKTKFVYISDFCTVIHEEKCIINHLEIKLLNLKYSSNMLRKKDSQNLFCISNK